jgi:hypothetical protein
MQTTDYDADNNTAIQAMGDDADDDGVSADINAATKTMR